MKKRINLTGLLILITLLGRSQTTVCGNVTGHWTLVGSPYIVTCNINIVDSLIIDPGVSVKFNAGLFSIIIDAGDKFIARGTSNNPIVFESYTSQIPGGWNGLVFNGSGNDDSLFYCNIQSATHGINISGSDGPFIFGGSLFNNLNDGIYVMGGATPFISDCIIHHNQDYGIEVTTGTTAFIQNSIIYENLKGGIKSTCGGTASTTDPKIFNCLIVQNCGSGIEVFANGTTSTSRPEIANCTIAFNVADGLSAEAPSGTYPSADGIIYNSIFAYNGGFGIRNGIGGYVGVNDITFNCFWQNGSGQVSNISGAGFGCLAQTGQYLNANNIACDINLNICYDPMFTDLYCIKCNGGNNLQSSSNCINAAVNLIFGQLDTSVHDIGAYLPYSQSCVSPCLADSCISTASIGAVVDENNLFISPNPASSTFTILTKTQLKNAQVEIFNLLGEKMYAAAYRERLTVNCELFPKGIYFVKVLEGRKQRVQKLIIQ